MNHRIAICLAVLTTVVASAGCARETQSTEKLSEKEINSLVKRLISPNKAPKIHDGGVPVYPPGYDSKAQEQVIPAWRKLQKSGLQAFPYLFDRFDDERYSFTQDAGPGYFNWSVGRASFDIVRYQLFPFHSFSISSDNDRGPFRPDYWTHYNLRTPAGAKAWWKTREQKSLRELQIEVLEWIIAEEAKAPEAYSDHERTRLQNYLTKLRDGKTPLEAGLPWFP